MAATEIVIEPVTTKAGREAFVDFGYAINASDLNWVLRPVVYDLKYKLLFPH